MGFIAEFDQPSHTVALKNVSNNRVRKVNNFILKILKVLFRECFQFPRKRLLKPDFFLTLSNNGLVYSDKDLNDKIVFAKIF